MAGRAVDIRQPLAPPLRPSLRPAAFSNLETMRRDSFKSSANDTTIWLTDDWFFMLPPYGLYRI
ncbi:hypothetical protein EJB05_30996 [Eragrostis curvula]|uniref:Uncharacterized protein n=1 Tax=Eragrostis curvula TaxID=38414 RepID=A0A5J9UCS7_9POAL|nr:hypothetical protein EJB05_30996 [Eragrostis curvula]